MVSRTSVVGWKHQKCIIPHTLIAAQSPSLGKVACVVLALFAYPRTPTFRLVCITDWYTLPIGFQRLCPRVDWKTTQNKRLPIFWKIFFLNVVNVFWRWCWLKHCMRNCRDQCTDRMASKNIMSMNRKNSSTCWRCLSSDVLTLKTSETNLAWNYTLVIQTYLHNTKRTPTRRPA